MTESGSLSTQSISIFFCFIFLGCDFHLQDYFIIHYDWWNLAAIPTSMSEEKVKGKTIFVLDEYSLNPPEHLHTQYLLLIDKVLIYKATSSLKRQLGERKL